MILRAQISPYLREYWERQGGVHRLHIASLFELYALNYQDW
jgi:hypothetical protein